MPRPAGVKTRVERAALELFAANGFDGVSIAEIAAAAGVSQGALYRHYASKDELAWTLFSTAYLRTGADLDMIRASRSGLDARVTAMAAHLALFTTLSTPMAVSPVRFQLGRRPWRAQP